MPGRRSTFVAWIPPGALELTGEAVRRRRSLQRSAMEVFGAAGYEESIPPTFEYEEVFLRAGGSNVAERLIRFIDLDGRVLALRYDFTASLARMAATTFGGHADPLRLCYSGKVFRQEPERGGRPREILQAGAELLGVADISADLEVLKLTFDLARGFGLRDFQVNLGHAAILAPGLAALESDERAEVRSWIDRKDRASLTAALAAAPEPARSLAVLPFVIGRRAALEGALESAPPTARPGLRHLLELDQRLSAEDRAHVVYDLGEVRGLDYYTGAHFELFIAGAGRAVGTGGRYDGLMARFGRTMPAVGVSLDLDAIAEVER